MYVVSIELLIPGVLGRMHKGSSPGRLCTFCPSQHVVRYVVNRGKGRLFDLLWNVK